MSQSNFNLLTGFLTTVLALSGVLAGLEDAKHSTKLDHSNFDAQIQVPQIGTLTAFFAPWCGHCKSLQGTWDIVAEAFKTDSKCRVGHFDANDAANRDIASRFSVSGFPTIKFVFKDTSKPALEYQEARSPEAFIKFLNKHCGTHRAAGGLLLPEAGLVAGLDEMVASFFSLPVGERPALIKKATEFAATANEAMASYYLKVMNKLTTEESWLTKESERLKKLAEKGATMAGNKFEELQLKQNVLRAFIAAQEAVKGGVKTAEEGAQQVVDRVKEEL